MEYTLLVECRCVPHSPFYVRWLNQHGGVDYWMFQKRQEFSVEQSGQQLFNPYIDDYSTADGTTKSASKDIEERVTAGAEGLNKNQWDNISKIAYSKLVQWFDERVSAWVDITVDKADISMLTDATTNSVEFEFLLPTPQLQY